MQQFSGLRKRIKSGYSNLFGLVCLGMLWSATAAAEASAICPVINANVVSGGMVVIDVSDCDGPFDGGMSGPIAPHAAQGQVSIGKNSGGVQVVTYRHNGGSATSDVFFLEDNENGVVKVKITIVKSKSRKS